MTNLLKNIATIIVLIPVLLICVPSFADSHIHTIEGLIVDKENRPVENVWVRIYRGKKEIQNELTKSDGRYRIEFKSGSPITLVRYDHVLRSHNERRHPVIVRNLSGNKNHNIVKIMPDKIGMAYDEHTLLEMFSAYEHIFMIDSSADISGTRKDIFELYTENFDQIKHINQITLRRQQFVSDMYRCHDKGKEPPC